MAVFESVFPVAIVNCVMAEVDALTMKIVVLEHSLIVLSIWVDKLSFACHSLTFALPHINCAVTPPEDLAIWMFFSWLS